MRSNEKLTAALLVAALAGVGCSKSDERLQAKVDIGNAKATKVSMVNTSDKGLDFTTTKPAGPVSFVDGETAYKAGNFSEATKIFDEYTGEKPNNAWGHYMLGLSAWKSGDPVKAEKAFDESLRLDPNHFKSLVNLSRVLIDQGRYDDALPKLTRAGEIDSKSADVQRLLGRTYEAQGKTDDAVHAYLGAIALDSKDAWSMNNLGLVFMAQERHSDAVPLLARAVELRKDVAMFHNNLGMALEHTGRFAAAAGEYRGAVEADPGYQKAKQNLARVEAVKVGSEEPFDLEATARSFSEKTPEPVKTPEPSEKTTTNQ
jgi:Flp pilus assembly protein TadD